MIALLKLFTNGTFALPRQKFPMCTRADRLAATLMDPRTSSVQKEVEMKTRVEDVKKDTSI